MVKAFFGILILALAALIYVSAPKAMMRSCPVCQGYGRLSTPKPLMVAKGHEWIEKKDLLCPFCTGGQLSLYDLRNKEDLMLRWMVVEQKLPPDVLVKRVRAGWGEEGVTRLHEKNFFINK